MFTSSKHVTWGGALLAQYNPSIGGLTPTTHKPQHTLLYLSNFYCASIKVNLHELSYSYGLSYRSPWWTAIFIWVLIQISMMNCHIHLGSPVNFHDELPYLYGFSCESPWWTATFIQVLKWISIMGFYIHMGSHVNLHDELPYSYMFLNESPWWTSTFIWVLMWITMNCYIHTGSQTNLHDDLLYPCGSHVNHHDEMSYSYRFSCESPRWSSTSLVHLMWISLMNYTISLVLLIWISIMKCHMSNADISTMECYIFLVLLRWISTMKFKFVSASNVMSTMKYHVLVLLMWSEPWSAIF